MRVPLTFCDLWRHGMGGIDPESVTADTPTAAGTPVAHPTLSGRLISNGKSNQMATTPQSDDASSSGPMDNENVSDGVELAARVGYLAKGVVYAVIGGLALQQAVGRSGEITNTREALQEIGSAAFGQVLLWIMAAGLVGYVTWRLVQALVDPEGHSTDDSDSKRWGKRAFYLLSAIIYGVLAWYAASLAMGTGGGGGGSGGSSWESQVMQMPAGRWILGAIGIGFVARGLLQFGKAYTGSFKERISSFDLGPGSRKWVMRASRVGLTARGVVFSMIGAAAVYAARTPDPQNAEGTEGVLSLLVGTPWLLGAMGFGLICYAVYQGVKARYRLIGV
ncbi:MAG: DUF1206 domain-containing protein [Gemmatimonadota bacterium]